MISNDIKNKFRVIKQMGYVESLRKGPTGIGYTLETLLGIEENNINLPDLGNVELKVKRDNQNSMITLFTFNKKAWKMNPLEAIKRYGSRDKNDRLGMYYTMSIKPNKVGLFLCIKDDFVSVRHTEGDVIAVWELQEIERRFEKKVKNILLVKAKIKKQNGVEYFHFNKAKLLSGGTTKTILKSKFENQELLIDLRLHDKGTMARNHGTGFRVYENNLENLYEKVEEINF